MQACSRRTSVHFDVRKQPRCFALLVLGRKLKVASLRQRREADARSSRQHATALRPKAVAASGPPRARNMPFVHLFSSKSEVTHGMISGEQVTPSMPFCTSGNGPMFSPNGSSALATSSNSKLWRTGPHLMPSHFPRLAAGRGSTASLMASWIRSSATSMRISGKRQGK